MRYKVYLDRLLADTLLWNYCLLALTNLRYGFPASGKRVLLGAVLGACTYGLSIFLPFPAFVKGLCGLLGNAAMLAVSFPVRTFRNYLKVLRTYLISCFLMGGGLLAICNLIDMKKQGTGCLLGAGILFTLIECRKGPGRGQVQRGVGILETKGQKARITVMVDSGNSLREPISGKPVCVVSAGIGERLWNSQDPCRVIPYRTVEAQGGYMRGYLVRSLTLELGGPVKTLKEVYVAVSPGNLAREGKNIDLLVHPELLKESPGRRSWGLKEHWKKWKERGNRKNDHACTFHRKDVLEKSQGRETKSAGSDGGALLHWGIGDPAAAPGGRGGDKDDRGAGIGPP